MARTFAVDVLCCPSCQGRMRLLVVIKESASIARSLGAVGEATEVVLCQNSVRRVEAGELVTPQRGQGSSGVTSCGVKVEKRSSQQRYPGPLDARAARTPERPEARYSLCAPPS